MSKKAAVAVALVCVSLFGVSSGLFASGPLDGKTFSGTMGQKGKIDGQADGFVFKDGKFESTLCTTFGYGQGAYKTEAKADAIGFTAETASSDGGKMEWHGTVKGDQIAGTVISIENGTTTESWFKGKLKAS